MYLKGLGRKSNRKIGLNLNWILGNNIVKNVRQEKRWVKEKKFGIRQN